MLKVVDRFETVINSVLLCLMSVVVVLATIDLGALILKSAFTEPFPGVHIDNLLALFSAFLLVLIGVELLNTVRTYMADKRVHVEAFLSVGLVAITRKVVVLEPKQMEGQALLGIAAILLGLAVSYYLIKRRSQPPSEL